MTQRIPEGKHLYEIVNTVTEERWFAIGTDPEDACKQTPWHIDECVIEEQLAKKHPDRYHDQNVYVKCAIRVCPFQFCACTLAFSQECPHRPTSPDFKEWMRQALEAHKCEFEGEEINDKQWRERQILRPLEKVLGSYTPKR